MPDRLPGEDEPQLQPPPRVRPLNSSGKHSESGGPRRTGTFILLLALAVLAAATFFVLPRWAAERKTTTPPDEPLAGQLSARESQDGPENPRTQSSAKELRERAYLEELAEEARDHALGLQAVLEDQAVDLWAGKEHQEAGRLLVAGQEHLRAGRFQEAEKSYRAAGASLEAADSRSSVVLQELLDEGRDALARGSAVEAGAAFRLALRIAPENNRAASGLERAAVLDDVRAFLSAGGRSERNGDLKRAASHYRDAVALDPLTLAAQEALARVEGRRSDQEFSRAMSMGLEALNRGDTEAAAKAFQEAERIRPGTPQVAEALVQAAEQEKLTRINRHRSQALSNETAEQWQAAAQEYDAVLALEPTLRFAQEGQTRSKRRAKLAERLDYHLAHAERLSSGEVLGEVSDLVDDAANEQPRGPVLQGQLARLRGILEVASRKIRVVLESDNMTEVTVYHVGRLGLFGQRELELRPGTYTVVGTRQGFRDVRRELVVVAGEDAEPLIIRCEEEI